MAKMGISTLQSYKGAQIFEVVGLTGEVVELAFPGTASRLGGLGWSDLLHDCLSRHQLAFGDRECDSRILPNPVLNCPSLNGSKQSPHRTAGHVPLEDGRRGACQRPNLHSAAAGSNQAWEQ